MSYYTVANGMSNDYIVCQTSRIQVRDTWGSRSGKGAKVRITGATHCKVDMKYHDLLQHSTH